MVVFVMCGVMGASILAAAWELRGWSRVVWWSERLRRLGVIATCGAAVVATAAFLVFVQFGLRSERAAFAAIVSGVLLVAASFALAALSRRVREDDVSTLFPFGAVIDELRPTRIGAAFLPLKAECERMGFGGLVYRIVGMTSFRRPALALVALVVLLVGSGFVTLSSPNLSGAGNVMALLGVAIVFSITVPCFVTWVVLELLSTPRDRGVVALRTLANCVGAGTAAGLMAGCLSFYFLRILSAPATAPSSQNVVAAFVDMSVLGAAVGYVVGLFVVLYGLVRESSYPLLGALFIPLALGVATASTNDFASPRAVASVLIDGLDRGSTLWAQEMVMAKGDLIGWYPSDGWYVAIVVALAVVFSVRALALGLAEAKRPPAQIDDEDNAAPDGD